VFHSLKAQLTSSPVLTPYDPGAAHTVIVTDASKFALGAALMQGESLVALRPVGFYSRKLSKAEREYPTREQELLGIKEALRVWKHYTMAMPVEVKTDHDSLRFINSQPNLTGQLARWFGTLSEYNLKEIRHIPGKDNVVADALSRCPDYAALALLSDVGFVTPRSKTLADLLEAQTRDPFCQKLLDDLRTLPAHDPVRVRYQIAKNGALVWTAKGRQRIVVPPAFRRDLISDAHESQSQGTTEWTKRMGRLQRGTFGGGTSINL
jgi:hypothetical protein